MPHEKENTILKSHIINSLGKEFPSHYKEDLSLFVDLTLDAITSALKEGRRVEIRGFGSFNIHEHKCLSLIHI